jgi:hypothetical protein
MSGWRVDLILAVSFQLTHPLTPPQRDGEVPERRNLLNEGAIALIDLDVIHGVTRQSGRINHGIPRRRSHSTDSTPRPMNQIGVEFP